MQFKMSNTSFIQITIAISVLLALLYFWDSLITGFDWGKIVIIGMNLVYAPSILIFKRTGFALYNLVYSIVLLFVLSFMPTMLFNNYSALFIVFLVVMVKPKWERVVLILFAALSAVTFALNKETVYHFLIYIVRSSWFIITAHYILHDKFDSSELVLYPDEIKILQQMADGNLMQKEVEGFSENTVYRKLKSARKRNGDISRDELLEKFKKQQAGKNLHN